MTTTMGPRRDPGVHTLRIDRSARLVVFRCANSERPNLSSQLTAGRPLSQTRPDWPVRTHEIAIPCSGKLQPEHLLKAFEAGADGVCVLACPEDGCHYLEGSRRLRRRAEYVRTLLDELGLGGERLMLFHLPASTSHETPPGTPQADMSPEPREAQEELCSRLAAITNEVTARLEAMQPNPLREATATA